MNAQTNLTHSEAQAAAVPSCFAYEENGSICGAPAIAFDAQRGCMVCEKHRPAISLAEQVLGPMESLPDLSGQVSEETEPPARVEPTGAGPSSTGVTDAGPIDAGEIEDETIEYKQGDVSLVIRAAGPWRETELGKEILRALEPIAKKLGVELYENSKS
jgi:hypothetical protein